MIAVWAKAISRFFPQISQILTDEQKTVFTCGQNFRSRSWQTLDGTAIDFHCWLTDEKAGPLA
jgi:hypothetical protein